MGWLLGLLASKEEERQHQAVEYELMMKERERLESAVQEKRQQANRLDNKKKGEKSKTLPKVLDDLGMQNDWHQAKKTVSGS